MIFTDEQVFKLLMLIQDISIMKDSAKMQTHDLVDIINEQIKRIIPTKLYQPVSICINSTGFAWFLTRKWMLRPRYIERRGCL